MAEVTLELEEVDSIRFVHRKGALLELEMTQEDNIQRVFVPASAFKMVGYPIGTGDAEVSTVYAQVGATQRAVPIQVLNKQQANRMIQQWSEGLRLCGGGAPT